MHPSSALRRTPSFLRLSPLAACLLAALPHLAQAQQDSSDSNAPAATLAPVVVTGNPLGSDTLASPSTVLEGKGLDLRRAGSLGATLDGLPGISSTSYGPFASRPIIRGLDGDRIRLMSNGMGMLDASSLSYDHAVPMDPLSADRIEIVRGPAALLYGGNAIGGVVNTLDSRIPSEPIDGVSGDVLASYGGANRDRNGGVRVDGGNGTFAIHADAYARETGELRIPGYARSASLRAQDPRADEPRGRLPNSDGRDSGGAVGMAWTGEHGYLGLSASGYDANYGSVAEPDVRLKMRQNRYALAGETRDLDGPFKSLKFNLAYTDYEHKEIEGGETGTIFRNHGYEARLEARHADIGPVSGTVGLQFGQSRFSALGDEALVPQTDTDSAALFALEEWKVNERLTLSAGARAEHTRLSPAGGGLPRFAGSSERDFTAGSFSLGAVYKLTPIWSLAANGAYTERAPTFYELYANGPHAATGQFLTGDQDLGKERAWSGDLSLRWAHDADHGSVGVFYSRFANFLAELPTGRWRDDGGGIVAATDPDALPEARYRGVPAELYGLEAESSTRVFKEAGHALDLGLSGDYTRARDLDSGNPLPRIAPLRLRASLDYSYGSYSAGVAVTKAFSQHRHAEHDTPTAGYYSLDLALGYRFKMDETQWMAYVRGENLTNQEIRYASSVLRDTAPQGGRAVLAGLRGTF
jgi:iron complex outermembrane receptor protein